MLARGEAEGQEEGGQGESAPEPGPGAGRREAAEEGFEDLPSQGQEERKAQANGATDAVGYSSRLALEKAQVGAAAGTPVPGPVLFTVTYWTDQVIASL